MDASTPVKDVETRSVKKTVCEKYMVKVNEKYRTWAEINLDENTGAVNILSDYGNWGYAWRSIGTQTLKEFLVRCDNYYLIGKFGTGVKVFDAPQTAKNCKKQILDLRREKSISADVAREGFDELDRAEVEFDRSPDLFWNHLMPLDAFQNWEPWEYGEYIDEPSLTNFFEIIWPVFIEHLKGEIKTMKESIPS